MICDRANLLDAPYLDTAANPNHGTGATFDPYASSNQGYVLPQPLSKPKQQNETQSSPNESPYYSNTFDLEF